MKFNYLKVNIVNSIRNYLPGVKIDNFNNHMKLKNYFPLINGWPEGLNAYQAMINFNSAMFNWLENLDDAHVVILKEFIAQKGACLALSNKLKINFREFCLSHKDPYIRNCAYVI